MIESKKADEEKKRRTNARQVVKALFGVLTVSGGIGFEGVEEEGEEEELLAAVLAGTLEGDLTASVATSSFGK